MGFLARSGLIKKRPTFLQTDCMILKKRDLKIRESIFDDAGDIQ
jgi:hypothetical protein